MLEAPASDPLLKRWYNKWNAQYFGGELSDETCLWWEPLAGHGETGDRGIPQHSHGKFTTNPDLRDFYVIIEPAARYSRSRWGLDLYHEMAHLHLWPYEEHGKRFQAEMLRLAQLGAFKGLW